MTDRASSEPTASAPAAKEAGVVERPEGQDADPAAKPKDDEQDEAERRQKALNRLMMRIAEQADFPSLKDSIASIQKITRSDRAHLAQLSGQVLNDVGLTSKLLRIINAAFYRSVGGGSITSMERAVALLGFESVGMLAASLMLFDKIPKGRDGEAARQACSRALMSGLLAQQMCNVRRHADSVYLTALFMNLGPMLVAMHFPNEARAIQGKTDDAVASLIRQAEANAALHTGAKKEPPQPPSAAQVHEIRQRVAREVLGLTEEELGLEVARQWGWPENLVNQLRPLHPTDAEEAAGPEEYLRVLCTAATELSHDMHKLPRVGKPEDVAEARDACMRRFGSRMAAPLLLDPESLLAVGEHAMDDWADLALLLGIQPDGTVTGAAARLAAPAFQPKPPPPARGPDRISQGLQHALQALAQAVQSYAPLEHLVEQMMADLTEALQLQRVVVCLREAGREDLRGNTAAGLRASTVCQAFHVPLAGSQDLFSVLCLNAKDALIADAGDPVVAKRLPGWYSQRVAARTFVLLPMVHHARVHGLIYADRQMAGSLVLNPRELALLKAVRDQLVAAMDHRGLTRLD